ncbi:MAG: M20/M25/M40 family metallo-hydrolase [Thermoanaerobaculia bacterium]
MRRFHTQALAVGLMLTLAAGLGACRRAGAGAEDPAELEAEKLLVEYLRLDTSNPPGNETRGAEFFRRIFEAEGIESRLIGEDPARQSIWARIPSGKQAPALLLLHHIDVVPADPAEWSVPPFGGRRANGYFWGRGALDTKSLGIAHLMAMLDLHRRRAPLERDLIFLAVADEEAGGLKGVSRLLELHPELFERVGWVFNEGGANETVVDRVRWWGIEIDQKVPLWVELQASGEPGHGSVPPADGGATAKLVRAVGGVLDIPTPSRLTPSVAAQFRSLGRVKPGIQGEILRAPEKFFGTEAMDNLSPGTMALLQNTVALSVLRAGDLVNVIPSSARAEIDVRLLPGTDPDPFLDEIRRAVGANAEVSVILQGDPSPPSPIDTPIFALVSRIFTDEMPGSVAGPFVSTGSSDSRFLRAHGIPTYGVMPFMVNYYDGAGVHGPDEKIRVRFFSLGVKLMRKIVREAVALPESS